MFIVDAHLDLAYNALHYGRDLRLDLAELRSSEPSRSTAGRATVTFPELLEGGVGLVFGTLFVSPSRTEVAGDGGRMVYTDSEQAHRLAMEQLDDYHRLVDEDDRFRLVGNHEQLDEVTSSHQPGGRPLLGIVPLLEGADPVRDPGELEYWYDRGLRLIGLAWDDTRYADGAWRGSGRGVTKAGTQMLETMSELGFILDLTHMSEKATLEALDIYEGAAVATHSNARALVPTERQLSDRQIRRIGERDGVIGTVLFNGFLKANHRGGDSKEMVTLDHVAAHIDHMCQLLGDANHVGLGSDLDGGFGAEDIPHEMGSIRDLQLIASKLQERGYDHDDTTNIMGGNWLKLLRRAFD